MRTSQLPELRSKKAVCIHKNVFMEFTITHCNRIKKGVLILSKLNTVRKALKRLIIAETKVNRRQNVETHPKRVGLLLEL